MPGECEEAEHIWGAGNDMIELNNVRQKPTQAFAKVQVP